MTELWDDPFWLRRLPIKMPKSPFQIAQLELGVREVPGSGDNPRIVEYLESTSLGQPENQNDETSWCAAFVSWCLEQAGIKSTRSAWSRSYLEWGREPGPNDEWRGCVVILERGEYFGHVGFLDDWDDDRVRLLGGNQGDAVSYAWFPVERVLGYRVPKDGAA
jgi:uncharacterized protein (TIGR02594 family)